MSKTEQNSVEWLESIVNAMIENGGDADLMAVIEHIQQAKAMHKEETCQFVSDYLDDADYGMTAEEYYDQIYKDNTP